MNPRKRKIEIEVLLKGINVKAKDGKVTDAEVKQGHALLTELAEVKALIEQMDASAQLMGDISAIDPEGHHSGQPCGDGEKGYLRATSRSSSPSGSRRRRRPPVAPTK